MIFKHDFSTLMTLLALGLGVGLASSATAEPTYRLARQDEPDALPPQREDVDLPVPDPETVERIYGPTITPEILREIDEDLLDSIFLIEDPGELTLSLIRAARSKILGEQYEIADLALERAALTVEQITLARVRDLRLIGVVNELLALAEARINRGTADTLFFGGLDPEDQPTLEERFQDLQDANRAFGIANRLAAQITQSSYRAETLFDVAERQGQGSQRILSELDRRGLASAELQRMEPTVRELADLMLVEASQTAWLIERPVWRDRALAAVSGSAALSNQFDRGLEIARQIPFPEVRFDALLRVADGQTRRGSSEQATAIYAEAARSVSSISITDLRSTMTNVLIDSLIAAGRFEDARASIVLYPQGDTSRQLEALGAIAQSQGFRGLSKEAREWIGQEVRPEYRSILYRRVNDGVVAALDRYRTDAVTRGGMDFP